MLTREQWKKKNSQKKTEKEIIELDSDQIREITDEESEITLLDEKEFNINPSNVKSNRNAINIVNCSSSIIFINNLFGPTNSLVLGTVEDPSHNTLPFITVSSDFRQVLDNNIVYQSFIKKGLLREVENDKLRKFINNFYELLDKKIEVKYSNSTDNMIKMNEISNGPEFSVKSLNSDNSNSSNIKLSSYEDYVRRTQSNNQQNDSVMDLTNLPDDIKTPDEYEEENIIRSITQQ